jgi:thymidylate synthase (FAD)
MTKIPVLDKGHVEVVQSWGSDLTVVNAARVSFNKHSDVLTDKDRKLIHYLAKHQHWTCFGHCGVTLRLKWPVFVGRQAMRSNIGICWNEVSRRYVDDEPEFYEPEVWRGRPDGSIKQGSAGNVLLEPYVHTCLKEVRFETLCLYQNLIKQGVAPEMARMVLPQSTYTEAWGTFSLAALARFYKLRADSHAQLEIQEFAHAIDSLVCPMFPVSWAALTNKE